MLTPTNVTASEYNAAVKADAYSHIRLTFTEQNIVFTDSDFEQNGVIISNILNGDTDLTMGRAVMSSITAYLFVSDKTQRLVWERECQLEIGLDVNGNTEWITIGYYTGKRPEKINANNVIEFIAYDRMYKFDVVCKEWLENLTFPMDVQDMYDSLCTFVGTENVTGDELSGIMGRSYTAPPIVNGGLLCRDILALIAEAAGCYAMIDHNGKVKLVWYEDHTDYVITGNDEFRVDSLGLNFSTESKTWEDLESYTWEELEQFTWSDIEYYQQQLTIRQLTVKQTEDDVGVTVPSSASGTRYLIVDNPFLTVDTDADIAAYITPIYTRLHDFGGYLPMSVSCVGNPLVEVGDIITAEVKGEMVALPIFVKNMRCTSACTDAYEATGRLQREEVSPINREKLSQGGKFHIFRNDLNELYSELYDPTTGDVSVLQQTANALGLSAAGIDIVGEKYINISSNGELNVDGSDVNIEGSNVNIKSASDLEIDGSSVKIKSGSTFDIEGSDISITSGSSFLLNDVHFKIDSNNRLFKLRSEYGGYTDYIYLNISGIQIGSVYQDGTIFPLFCFGGVPAISKTIDGVTYPKSFGISPLYQGLNHNTAISLSLGNEQWEELLFEHHLIDANICRIFPSQSDKWDIGDGSSYFRKGYISTVYYYTLAPQSSKYVKHDIKSIRSKGEEIDKLKPVSFIYNHDETNKVHQGLIYEDTVGIFPEICNEDDDGTKSISYVELVPILLKEIQDLRKRVAILEGR